MTDGPDSPLEDMAHDRWFVVLSYLVAFLPWVVYGALDKIDRRWKKVGDLRRPTATALAVCTASGAWLVVYLVVQYVADDPKEAMAAGVVLAAAWLPHLRLYRQVWVITAADDLGKILNSLPTFGGCDFRKQFTSKARQDPVPADWDPGNSNKFFDNDGPGEGVTDVSLRECFRLWLRRLLAQRRLNAAPLPACPLRHFTMDNDSDIGVNNNNGNSDGVHCGRSSRRILYSKERYSWAMDVLRHELRLVASYRRLERRSRASERELRRRDANFAEDDLTRAAWFYENLTGLGWSIRERGALARVLHLGLVVHVGLVILDGFEPGKLTWVRALKGEDVPISAHLRQPSGLLGQSHMFLAREDFEEAFAKLPSQKASRRGAPEGHLTWERVMCMVSATIELHALVMALFGDSPVVSDVAGVGGVAWKYLLGTCVANHCHRDENQTLTDAPGTLASIADKLSQRAPYGARLEKLLGPGARAQGAWTWIVVVCGNIADVVTRGMHGSPPEEGGVMLPPRLREAEWGERMAVLARELNEAIGAALEIPRDGDKVPRRRRKGC